MARFPQVRCLVTTLVLLVCAGAADAEVKRYAVLVGSNRGMPGETDLLYAESDVQRIGEILTELGGFAPHDVVLLSGRQAEEVRAALHEVEDRIRGRSGSDQAVLLVYYSGHADAEALHLGGSVLPVPELERLVASSPAVLRILVLDACRSGALTRVKGFVAEAPFGLESKERLPGEGTVFITSSSLDEDAQESDKLGASFFTHHFASGLLGAADASGDGRVALSEAYRYTYERTIASTSRTLSGTQHPTYRFDIRGKADLVLTELGSRPERRARLVLPAGNYMVMKESDGGQPVAEVHADGLRRIDLPPGDYFVRLRGRAHLHEGTVRLDAGRETRLRVEDLERIPYARMVRKGGTGRNLAQGPVLFFSVRDEISAGFGWQPQGGVGYALHFPWFTVTPRLIAGTSTSSNAYLDARQTELTVECLFSRALDLPWVTLALGLGLGTSFLHQDFHAEGPAPSRDTLALVAGIHGEVTVELGLGLFVQAQAGGAVYVFEERDENGETGWATPLVPRFSVGLGYGF